MIELRTLGTLEVRYRGEPGPGPNTLQSKRLVLLAYLAAAPVGGFRRRDTLLGLFWPELDQEHARGSLRQALHTLRKALGEGAIVTRGESEIGLDATLVTSDARALEAHLADGDPVVALSNYRGDFLEGVFVADASPELEEWISAERLRLRRVAAKAAWAAAERPSGRGETGQYVRRAVLLSGDDEAALRRGIALLDRMGDRAAAAALFEEFASRVARELDIEPSAESQAAMEVVRNRRGATPVPASSGRVVEAPSTASGPSRPPARRSRRTLLIAGAVGGMITLALIALMAPRRSAADPSAPQMIAVAPFRVSEVDSSLAWLREGIVELLTIRLAADGGPRLADPGATLSAWSLESTQAGPGSGAESLALAASRVGASHVIDGSITGTSERVTLTARLSLVSGGTPLATVSVEGPPDSLSGLLDLLASRLLGEGVGLGGDRLAQQTAPPLPAMRAFVAGQRAYRAGHMAAASRAFTEAIELDSSFALAGLKLVRAATWTRQPIVAERGLRVAAAGRGRLGAADRAVLDATLADEASTPGAITRWNAVVTAYPERPEGWYSLGDAHWRFGMLAGEGQSLERAGEAFHRGWLMDSAAGAGAFGGGSVAEPMLHMVELAHIRGDTAAVLRMVAQVLDADSTTDLARTLMWHRALVTSDSARRAFWRAYAGASQLSMMWIHLFVTWTGIGTADLASLLEADAARIRTHDPGFGTFALAAMALNAGRPSEVPPQGAPAGDVARTGPRARLRRALWWDADTVAALEAEGLVAASVNRTPESAEAAREQLYDICTLGEWRARRGDLAAAKAASVRLRAAHLPTLDGSARLGRYVALCASILDAMYETGRNLPGARRRVAAADSLARTFIYEVCCREAVTDANLQLASLWEQLGDVPRALAAVRRGAGQFGEAPHYLVTFLREEGRLAAVVGDTVGAVRAYRHYLAFRYDPEPSLQPAVDSVRAALATLEGPRYGVRPISFSRPRASPLVESCAMAARYAAAAAVVSPFISWMLPRKTDIPDELGNRVALKSRMVSAASYFCSRATRNAATLRLLSPKS